jgi:hypothetical protein
VSNMFYILGAGLAQEIGKDEILCRGALRMTITNSVKRLQQITDPVKVRTETLAYATGMTYQEWKAIIDGPAFSQVLSSIGVVEKSALTARLMQILVEQQSLFTMTAH